MENGKWDASNYRKNHAFVYEYGQEVLHLLAPQQGERILDLGCGTGELTSQIAAFGAAVEGMDASLNMLEKAKEHSPDIHFFCQDILTLDSEGEYDAVFSNAVLHWIREEDQPQAMKRIYRALRSGGRFVGELGGVGNCNCILNAFGVAMEKRGASPDSGFYYPTIGRHTSLLEQAGFLVRYAVLFSRPTVLEGERGMENWLRMFRAAQLSQFEETEQCRVLDETVAALRHTGRYNRETGSWQADYVRLRFVAEKPTVKGAGLTA